MTFPSDKEELGRFRRRAIHRAAKPRNINGTAELSFDLAKTPIHIRLSARLARELADCEEGAYSDAKEASDFGRNCTRPVESHAHTVASEAAFKAGSKRDAFLVIDSAAKADDMYYAVCSGVFKSKIPATLRAAQRIANILRPYANPDTVKVWDKPDPEPFNGL